MKKGLTLIELIICLGLISILLPVITSSFVRSEKIFQRALQHSARQQVARIVVERICREVRGALQIDSASSAGELCLLASGESIRYSLTGGKVKRTCGLTSAYLCDSGEIATLAFEYPAAGMVKVICDGAAFYVGKRN